MSSGIKCEPVLIQPHTLCDACKSIGESSVYIQTYVTYGSLENKEDLHHRCNKIRHGRETWGFHSLPALLECHKRGCHLCSMLSLEADKQISPQELNLLQSDQRWNEPLELFTSHSGRDQTVIFELKIERGLKTPKVVVLTSFLIKVATGNVFPSCFSFGYSSRCFETNGFV